MNHKSSKRWLASWNHRHFPHVVWSSYVTQIRRIMLASEPRMLIIFWSMSSNLFQEEIYLSFRHLFLAPHLRTYQSNIRVQLREVTKSHTSTLRGYVHWYVQLGWMFTTLIKREGEPGEWRMKMLVSMVEPNGCKMNITTQLKSKTPNYRSELKVSWIINQPRRGRSYYHPSVG